MRQQLKEEVGEWDPFNISRDPVANLSFVPRSSSFADLLVADVDRFMYKSRHHSSNAFKYFVKAEVGGLAAVVDRLVPSHLPIASCNFTFNIGREVTGVTGVTGKMLIVADSI